MPAAEVEITERLVRQLLADQHPDLADLSLLEISGGWDNALYRLGSSLAVRLPRRAVAVPLLENERRWLPQLAPQLPLPIPVALRMGRPGRGYPWPWSVRQWIEGETAVRSVPIHDVNVARALGAFLQALHVPAPAEAPHNPVRGVPLSERTPRMLEYVKAVSDIVDANKILDCWERVVGLPLWAGPNLWVHGDLHPANVLLSHGRIAGVIDFGDLTARRSLDRFGGSLDAVLARSALHFQTSCIIARSPHRRQHVVEGEGLGADVESRVAFNVC
jgi:aminoglycoside phosphotransferase (APT) family kinase protein